MQAYHRHGEPIPRCATLQHPCLVQPGDRVCVNPEGSRRRFRTVSSQLPSLPHCLLKYSTLRYPATMFGSKGITCATAPTLGYTVLSHCLWSSPVLSSSFGPRPISDASMPSCVRCFVGCSSHRISPHSWSTRSINRLTSRTERGATQWRQCVNSNRTASTEHRRCSYRHSNPAWTKQCRRNAYTTQFPDPRVRSSSPSVISIRSSR